jgi:hypothetical protein
MFRASLIFRVFQRHPLIDNGQGPLWVIRVDIAMFRSLARYTQHPTLPRPTETRLSVAFLLPICKEPAQPPQPCVLASLDLATRDARAATKEPASRLQ